jgi:hypothetical protein
MRVASSALTPLEPGPDPPLALVPREATCRAWTWHVARRSGRPESLVELSDAVAADLAALSEAIDEPDADLAILVQQLGASCALAVSSYLGYSITLIVAEVPVSFAVLEEFLDPREVLASVMVPLNALGDHTLGSEIVLYAGTPGAFVDLAADLNYALRAEAVRLDQHLLPPDPGLGGAGFTRLSRQNQAIGILVDRGYGPDDALAELRQVAERRAISVDAVAEQLIDSTRPPLSEEAG